METALREKVKRLGIMLGKKERIDKAVEELTAEVEAALAVRTVTKPNGEPLAPATPTPLPPPRKERPAAESGEAKPKSDKRSKQGAYMGALKGLGESDRKLVQAVRESQGIDEALLLAKRIKAKKAVARGEEPVSDNDNDSESDFDGSQATETFDEI